MYDKNAGKTAIEMVQHMPLTGGQFADIMDDAEVHDMLEADFDIKQRIRRVMLAHDYRLLKINHEQAPSKKPETKAPDRDMYQSRTSIMGGGELTYMYIIKKKRNGKLVPTLCRSPSLHVQRPSQLLAVAYLPLWTPVESKCSESVESLGDR